MRRIYRSIGIYALAQQVLSLKGLILLPIMTKNLSLGEYGVYSLASVSAAFLMWLSQAGLPSALIRLLPGQPETRRIVEDLNLGCVTVVATIATCFLVLIPTGGFVPSVLFDAPSRRLLAVAVLTYALAEGLRAVAFSYFRVTDRVNVYVRLEVLTQVLGIAGMVVALRAGAGVDGVFTAQALVSLGATAYVVLRHYPFIMLALPARARVFQYFRFSLPIMVPTLMVWILPRVDRYIINARLGVQAVGIYSANFAFAALVQGAVNAVAFVYEPLFAAHWNQGKREELLQAMRHSLTVFLFAAVPMVAGMTMLGTSLMTMMATAQIAADAGQILPYVGCSYVAYMLYGLAINAFLLRRKSGTSVWFSVVGGISNLCLNLLLIPRLGLAGASISMLLSHVLMALVAVASAWQYLPIRPEWASLGAIAAATLAMCLGLLLISQLQLHPLVEVAAGAAIYLSVIGVLRLAAGRGRSSARVATAG